MVEKDLLSMEPTMPPRFPDPTRTPPPERLPSSGRSGLRPRITSAATLAYASGLVLLGAALLGAGCNGCDPRRLMEGGGPIRPNPPGIAPTPPPAPGESLLEQIGALAAAPPGAAPMRTAYEVPVQLGDRVLIVLRSSAFDPVLIVTPPGGETLSNDDFAGRRDESRLTVLAPMAGSLKIIATSVSPGASGPFELSVRRTASGAASGLISAGAPFEGELAVGDSVVADGRFMDQLLVEGAAGPPRELIVRAREASIPQVVLLDPLGRALATTAPGTFSLTHPDTHRLQILSSAPGLPTPYRVELREVQQAAAVAPPSFDRPHHQLPTSLRAEPIAMGLTTQGSLGSQSQRLPSGEPADAFSLEISAGIPEVRVQLRSSDLDAYLMLLGPGGRHWENDDAGGGLNSEIVLLEPPPGQYQVIATAYRAEMAGSYELKVHGSHELEAPRAEAAQAQTEDQIHRGELAEGDATLRSGEWLDEYPFEWSAGETIHLEARSSAFDTYLIVHPPDGEQQDNDDGPGGGTDA
ncbi:MAG: hypothetical protein OEY14_10030, partial [Myxococcales bacterium]|nr:hypothetical protein [Myxococcales bacterium]